MLVFALAVRPLARGQRAAVIAQCCIAFKVMPHCCLSELAVPLRIISVLLREETMRWKISPHGHDARQIDLLVIAALIIAVVAALFYFDGNPQSPHTASFIVPSQSVRW